MDSGLDCQHSDADGTLAEQVYRRLSAAILSGRFAPGTKISEPVLAREYGVSRGPLREALHRLQERRLITRSANQGARVVQPSANSLVELFAVREALEGMAARLAATNAGRDEIAQLRAIMRESPADGMALVDGLEPHDHDFHVAIARCSRNPMLIDLLGTELYPLLRLYRGRPPGPTTRSQRATIEHERIVCALEDRDPELAELMMRRHIAAARGRREAALTHSGGSQ